MLQNKKSVILRTVVYLGILGLVCFIFIAGYIYTVVGEIQLKLDQISLSKTSAVLRPSVLEEDTSILAEDLEQFIIFVDGISKNFLADAQNSGQLLRDRSRYQVLQDVELPELARNSCEKVNCVQIKKSFDQIPSAIWKGLLGTEDFRFLEHRGVDPWAIARAIVVDIIAMKFIQGGSTLTQQLMKNMFLTSERKLNRKFKEMIYALYIENILSKEEIVTLYLNEMFWGTHQGIYLKGFHSASLAYFNKKPKFISEYEATILVSLLKGPGYYNPLGKGFKRLIARADAVFSRLKGLGLISKKEVKWNEKNWEEFRADLQKRNSQKSFFSYFLLSKNTEMYLESFEEFVLMKSYHRNLSRMNERFGEADVATKILIADKSCESFDCKNLFSFYSKFEREKRRSIEEEYHQVGSLFKPIVYDSFVTLGRNYNELVSTATIELDLKSGKWSPKDYSEAEETEISLKKALQKSKNIPLIRVASEIGFDVLERELSNRIPRMKSPLSEYPAQLLGALELSLEEVLLTYSKFLQDKCEDIGKQVVKFEESVLYYMSVADETTISRLATPPLKNALVFGKTGTSNNGLDNWYFAYDGKNAYLFWFGVESNRDEVDLRLSGASTTFMIFQDFMNHRGKQIPEIHCQTTI